MSITGSMKKAALFGFSLFLCSAAYAACEKPLTYDKHLDFGAATGAQDCVTLQLDPIGEKIRQYEPPSALQGIKGDPSLRSSIALIVDEKTGEIIYAKNPDARTSIASITKLMTAMVTLDGRMPLDERLTITNDDIDRVKGTHSRLAVGATLSRRELLHLALMSSENRAAAALARTYPGGTAAFVAAMNSKAARLGMAHTRFSDSTGLRSENQSTAEDLSRMVRAAHTYPLITELTTTYSYDVQLPIYKRAKRLAHTKLVAYRPMAFRNTNKLVNEPDWQIGVSKTGYISEAGHCLVMQATIANQPLIIVLLDSAGKYARIDDAVRIKKWLESSILKPSKRG
jgi:serine-type D-Ala-D-Ala endopeptidase (penicillin-binding protein 7)